MISFRKIDATSDFGNQSFFHLNLNLFKFKINNDKTLHFYKLFVKMNNPNGNGPGFKDPNDTKNIIFQHFMEFEGNMKKGKDGPDENPPQFSMPEGIFPKIDFPQGFVPDMNGPLLLGGFPQPTQEFDTAFQTPNFSMEGKLTGEVESPHYCHTEGPEPALTEQQIKFNEYILHVRPQKLLLYQNHLFNVMQPKKTQIDINMDNLPEGIHYTHILEFFKFNGIHLEPKQVYIKVRGLSKDKCTINCYNNYELAWKMVSLFGTKFTGRCLKLELPDYERGHKPRSNTFDEFCKEFDSKAARKLSAAKAAEKIPRKISANKSSKEKEEVKEKIETEAQAWGTELSLGDVIGCQAEDDGFQEVKPKGKPKRKVRRDSQPEKDQDETTRGRGKGRGRGRGRGFGRGRGERGRGRGERGRGDRGRGERGRGERGRGRYRGGYKEYKHSNTGFNPRSEEF